MADTTAIEWCDSTFNPWIGCTRVSPACDDCYAARSTPARTLGVAWGPRELRRRTSAANWKLPELWQRQAAAFQAQHGRRRRVFCASLADVFDNEVPQQWRDDLWCLISATPDIDWLLVTKRIGNVQHQVWPRWMQSGFPGNVWLGITVANQPEFDRDWPKLQALPVRVRFLSAEPLLGALDLWRALGRCDHGSWPGPGNVGGVSCQYCDGLGHRCTRLHWVICGGESGTKARPMHPDWVRGLRDQCAGDGVPFLFKQWGEWREFDDSGLPGVRTIHEGDPEWDDQASKCDAFMSSDGELIADIEQGRDGMGYRGLERIGKKAAGRLLDGRTHDEFPHA